MTLPPLLSVESLSLSIERGQALSVVSDLGFDLAAGETLALVGESGCGKSLSALALMRLLPPAIRVTGGEVRFREQDLLRLPESAMRRHRGRDMAMIFQEPGASLNAVLTVGQQIGEILVRRGGGARENREKAEALLRQVGIADPARRLSEYPFQLSGGMKQRVMIAIALAGDPALLIADEPTTALDVTVQSQILDLLRELQAERGMAMLLITHDLGVVARMAHRVGVMYAGQLVELSDRREFFANPRHPYSHALFAALPNRARRSRRLFALPGQIPPLEAMPSACRFSERCVRVETRCRIEAPPFVSRTETSCPAWVRCHFPGNAPEIPKNLEAILPDAPTEAPTPLLRIENLKTHFPIRKGILQRAKGAVRAVDGVSLSLMPGKTLALVGESGCGKTTMGRALMCLNPMTEGALFWRESPILPYDKPCSRQLRRQMQMVFQDPFASLNPRLSVGEILLEGMVALEIVPSMRAGRPALEKLLEQVGLTPEALRRYPHEFSGGQRQRVAIARALSVSPQLLICDEPTSALDVSVQAQILNLLKDLQDELGMAYLFITHNFSVVEYLAHEIAVMYLGRIVEQGEAGAVLSSPAHPYTEALLSAVPRVLEPEARPVIRLEGETPSPVNPPPGCHFHPRCPKAGKRCRENAPSLETLPDGRRVACYFRNEPGVTLGNTIF